jgi:hypothetical protein
MGHGGYQRQTSVEQVNSAFDHFDGGVWYRGDAHYGRFARKESPKQASRAAGPG